MDKESFLKLIKKHKEGKCTDQEQDLLYRFCENLQKEDITRSWSLTEEEKIRIQLLRKIRDQIQKQEKRQSKKILDRYLKIAAIFVGIIGLGIYFSSLLDSEASLIPENAITLELEDGSIKIIDNEGSTKILDNKGNVVGEQQGKQLVYDDGGSNEPETLVYNTLTVPYGQTFELLLSDKTRVHLNAGSSLRFPVQFVKGKDRQVYVSGEAYFDVEKDLEHPFLVNVDELNVRVLGTEFNVLAYPEDNTSEVVLVEGAVGLHHINDTYDSETSSNLEPGYKATFDRENTKIVTKEVITSLYTSWIKGELVFRNMTFTNILKKLERHYDVTIINKNEELSNKVFNANFGDEPIENVLNDLQENYGISYRIENNQITIQ